MEIDPAAAQKTIIRASFGSRMATSILLSLMILLRSAVAQPLERREQLIRLSLHQLHTEQFDSALAACAELRQLWPDDPAGYLNAANVYQTMMRDYRVRLFEAQFDSLIKRAVQLAEQQARKQSNAEMFFALGTARGYQALHRFRRGEWMQALRDASIALNAMERSRARDPSFVDPNLALALYEYWKAVKLDFGLGFFARRRDFAIRVLENVWAHGRYVSVDAAYALQTIYLQKGEYARALEINAWLQERFPDSPIDLYNRALILEKLDRPQEALLVWEKLIVRIQAFLKPSDGFLAECHWRRAQIYATEKDSVKLAATLQLASKHVQQRAEAEELEGPLVSFEEIKKAIEQMQKSKLRF